MTASDHAAPLSADGSGMAARARSGWRDYLELTKPRVVLLIVFTALVGMFLSVPGLPPLRALVFGSLGIWLAASSAAAVNHVIDQRIDKIGRAHV